MKLNLRDLFWLLLVIAIAIGWWTETSKVRREYQRVSALIPAPFIDAVEFARKNSDVGPHFRLARVNQDHDGEIMIMFRSGNGVSGAVERWRVTFVAGKWKVISHESEDA
ncbi:hypothetical protein [Anatilimnocola floriformis]|uniref:hypothetical protein n=1 Tax=Anatilimnocola floriformis TaxID=2948575 RepID=UPI0020C2F8A0|nr:hypothetical protein [Anatilimnocola floriformis]